MDSCYYGNGKNCVKDYRCPSQYECCTQLIDHDNKPIENPTYGICVKIGRCNTRTGLCNSKSVSRGGSPDPDNTTTENFVINTIEGYDNDNCNDNWKGAFWVLLVMVIVLLFIVFNLVMRNNQ